MYCYRIFVYEPIFKILFSSFLQTASSSGDPHVHIIKEVKATDEGLYTCIAGNVLGQATASAYLEVNRAGQMTSSSWSLMLTSLLLSLLYAQSNNFLNRLSNPLVMRPQRHLVEQTWTPRDFVCKQSTCHVIEVHNNNNNNNNNTQKLTTILWKTDYSTNPLEVSDRLP